MAAILFIKNPPTQTKKTKTQKSLPAVAGARCEQADAARDEAFFYFCFFILKRIADHVLKQTKTTTKTKPNNKKAKTNNKNKTKTKNLCRLLP